MLLAVTIADLLAVTLLYTTKDGWDIEKETVLNFNRTSNYDPDIIVKDLVLLSYVKLGFLFIFSIVTAWFPKKSFVDSLWRLVFWFTFWAGILQICKATLYNSQLSFKNVVFVSLGFTFFEFVVLWNLPKAYKYKKNKTISEKKQITDISVLVDIEGEDKNEENKEPEKKSISMWKLLGLLKPYFWPKGCLNKIRCFLTWVFVALSKVASLYSPILIGNAVTKLSDPDSFSRREIYKDIALYCMITLLGRYSSEMVRVIYLRVKQVAYVEVAEKTFFHLHSLSLEWHVQKKMGSVLRSLDRGINAANVVVSTVFLRLLPSIGECIAVFVIFYTTFDLPYLSATVLLASVLYVVVTVQVTLWRKQFRVETNKHDNNYHDKASDSIINYETVKYFTAETFEVKRYVESIEKYQVYSKCTEGTLSLLNMTQQTIIQLALFSCLYIMATEIIEPSEDEVEIGDFVTVQVYIMNLFTPLSFLGTIYNSVIQAIVDMTNLSEILGENPDVIDDPDAQPLKFPNSESSSKAEGSSLRFDNVSFHYPSNLNSGLKDVTFDVPSGTTTAIVGHTGAGKTTVSRLLFRFYDPLEGKILINDQNIADVTQISLRQAIGVVPQDTVLFNDTIMYNILYGRRDATLEEVENACRSAQILDFIYSLPNGFETTVGERG